MISKGPYELPDNWVWVSLDEVLDVLESGRRPKGGVRKYSEGVPSIGAEHLDGDGGFRLDRIRFVPKTFYERMTKGKIHAYDILVVKDGATTGKAAIVPANFAYAKVSVNEHVFILRVINELMDPYYLFRFLFSIQGQNQISERFQGTAQGGINMTFINDFPVPLPPRNEQKRIFNKIESLLEQNKTARRVLDKIPALLKKFRQLVLDKAFKGELTQRDPDDKPAKKLLERIREERRKRWEEELKAKGKDPRKHKYEELRTVFAKDLPKLPENWAWTNMGSIETFIGSGITPRGGKKVYVKEGIPFIRSQNVYPDGLHLESVAHVTSELHAKMKRTHVKSGDVLLNITGASIGRCTYMPDNFGPANVNQHVCIIRTGYWILPQYLSSFLNSQLGQSQIFSAQSGVTREGLNYTQLRAIHIPLAPLEEQRRIIERIKELFTLADQIEESVKAARERAEMIEQAILAKAFRGELVPQDPNDKPALTLLKRIKAERSQKHKTTKTQWKRQKVIATKKTLLDYTNQ